MHVTQVGQGTPVVLLHGVPSNPEHFDPLAAALSTHYEVFAPHLPGYGRTPAVVPALSLAEQVDALEAALIERNVTRAHVIGFSGGVIRGLKLAIGNTIDVLSVFSVSGLGSLYDAERAGFLEFAQALRAGADLRALAGPRFLSDAYRAAHPEAVPEVEAWIVDVDKPTLTAELESLAAMPDLMPALASLRCPVTVRAGGLDLAVPISHAHELVAAVPNGRLQLVEGAGHALMIEDYAGTLAAIEAHLRDS